MWNPRSYAAAAASGRARAIFFLLGVTAWAAPGFADTLGRTLEVQRDAIVAVVETQLAAFRRGDAQAAFSVAAPDIQRRFGTADQFIAMVRRDYAPVYRPRDVRFLELDVLGGPPLLRVLLIGWDGTRWQATYIMTKDANENWRIAGCTLIRLPGSAA